MTGRLKDHQLFSPAHGLDAGARPGHSPTLRHIRKHGARAVLLGREKQSWEVKVVKREEPSIWGHTPRHCQWVSSGGRVGACADQLSKALAALAKGREFWGQSRRSGGRRG